MSSNIKINYHNSLQEFKNVMDPVMNRMRTVYVNTQQTSIVSSLIIKPLLDIPYLLKIGKGLKNINVSAIPVFAGIGGLASLYAYLGLWGSIGAGVALFAVGYLLVLPYYLWQMTIIPSRHFHIGAYRVIRRNEYEYFSRAFLYEDFSFSGLYDYITELTSYQGKESESVEYLINHFNAEKGQLEQRIEELKTDKLSTEDLLKKAQQTSDEVINYLLDEQKKLDKAIVYLLELVKKANIALYRMKNGLFQPADLMIISGYTIYELRGDLLEKIIDIGTSGASPNKLPLKSSKYKDWAAVIVVNASSSDPYYNNPYPGSTIVSYRMEMGNDKIWVYNFHIDEKSNEMALDLTISDIIDTRVVYRLVHALCLLLQERGFPKEVEKNGQSSIK